MKPYKLLPLLTCLALILGACVPIVVPPAGEAVQPVPEVETAPQAVTEEAPAEAGPPPAPHGLRPDADTIAKIEAIAESYMTQGQIPGLAMCVVQDGQVAYSKGFGVADLDSKKPVTPSSVFQMASISKGMTAVAIMQLVEQGKVDLDAPVTDYLPYFTMADARYRDITVRQLLSHTSGLADDFGHKLKDVPDPMAQAVRDLADQELLSAPGEAWSYSRVGFTLLGQVIAEVTGMRFEDYMQQKILTPLGMEHSTFLAAEVDPDLGVKKYVNEEGGGVAVNQIQDCDARDAPACMLHANCEDMARWARVHLNRGELDGVRILNAESYDELWGPVASTPYAGYLGPVYGPPWQEYGLGWAMGELQGHRLVGHTGGVYGANTQIQMAPDDDLAVIVLANWLDDPAMGPFYATQTAIDVIYLLLGIDLAQLQ